MLEGWQQFLSEAHQIVKMVLGRDASTVVAERNSGIYRGESSATHAITSSSKSASRPLLLSTPKICFTHPIASFRGRRSVERFPFITRGRTPSHGKFARSCANTG